MFEINLIRDKSITPELKKKIMMEYLGGMVLVFMVFLVLTIVFINVSMRIKKLETQKLDIAEKIDTLIKKYSIEEWGHEWVESNAEVNLIGKIFDERILYSPRLVGLVKLLSEKMCIEKIDVAKGKNYMTLKIIALAGEEGEFGQVKEFSDKLEKSKLFGSGVRLASQERERLLDMDVNVIVISVPLKEAT